MSTDSWISPLGTPCPDKVREWIEARKSRKAQILPDNPLDLEACNWARQKYLDILQRNDEFLDENGIDAFDAGFWRGLSWAAWQKEAK